MIESGDRLIVEAVPGDVYWSCGLDKEAASKTDPKHFPGQNMLGKLYMEIRAEYRKHDENRAHAFQDVKSRNGSTSQAEKRKTPEDHSPQGNASKTRKDKTPPKGGGKGMKSDKKGTGGKK